MVARMDISPYLIHFTKGNDLNDAFNNLVSIISDGAIIGSNNLIKGGYNCVCFSEAPIDCLSNGLINSNFYSKYSPFGIIVNKEWLFQKGGRPVIYQTESEYDLLAETQKWRHMTYNLIEEPIIDFTWEREWRINIDELYINPMDCGIILPNDSWADCLLSMHSRNEEYEFQRNLVCYNDELLAESLREEFPWDIWILKNEQ